MLKNMELRKKSNRYFDPTTEAVLPRDAVGQIHKSARSRVTKNDAPHEEEHATNRSDGPKRATWCEDQDGKRQASGGGIPPPNRRGGA